MRLSGIILPIFSLPSKYGIGSFGKQAYEYADFLKKAGQSVWQILPLGVTTIGDSPYSSPSAFAGNPLFIDLEELKAMGLISEEDLKSAEMQSERHVDYSRVKETHTAVLKKAAECGYDRFAGEIQGFINENAHWIRDYALYMSLKEAKGGEAWFNWEDGLKRREPETLKRYEEQLSAEIKYHVFTQFIFFKQWKMLKNYVNSLGIKIIGDVPIYVPHDSCEVWAAPGNFLLDENYTPIKVAGVPPDYFSKTGQLWGNPIYNWVAMKSDGFGWWIRRIGSAAALFDVIRIDHFRGIESYYSIPYGEETAINGSWEKGPGMDLVGVLKGWFSGVNFIAEDLGVSSPELTALLNECGWPNMKVIEFGFQKSGINDHTPFTIKENCIAYTGTHDNAPVLDWYEDLEPEDKAIADMYLGLNESEGISWGMIRGIMGSNAMVAIAQMQDYLCLGKGCRTNVPGIATGNWSFRMLPGEATDELADKIYEMTRIYGRLDN